jgi:glyoxylase-like metal-dependent hydrolase (beta-lactamase superfamily II)
LVNARRLGLAVVGLAFTAAVAGCAGARARVMKRGLQSAVNEYFADGVWRWDTLGPGVHSYRMGFDRNLVIEANDGLVVIDAFNDEAARRLAGELNRRFPGRPVSHLIYSHYHLDHVRGGAALAPREVIAHSRCEAYWAALPAASRHGIVPPTRTVEGDTDLDLGGVNVRLVDLGKSHTDTLFAVYLPRHKVLFAADTVFVHALPPAGGPDMYRPGVLKAIERLAALDFNVYVPSHFDTGTKADFLEGAQLFTETHRLVRERASEGRVMTDHPDRFNPAFDSVLATLEPRFGKWHGGTPMLLLFVQATFVAEFLGY